ncbi:hypothetical protein FXO38_31561 [Capsicum annuum]|uniref:Uncharacterized protein n=1 Tax=Capsicum annuum TaxID=4072 RepID=A0A2G2Z208_CAPAN|nr:hypothetical protein FXO37_35365 [Capsicum annuum]KAF3621986.1 hypothetical protein FXO38_31561 [Capsicum annuum]PHT76060.1 hypothetical protein T459_19582 [Capsicum annuum]
MCQICFNIDYASNTCCWVGCDACEHWCHVVCVVQRKLFKPCQSISRPSEMHHACKIFGFSRGLHALCKGME